MGDVKKWKVRDYAMWVTGQAGRFLIVAVHGSSRTCFATTSRRVVGQTLRRNRAYPTVPPGEVAALPPCPSAPGGPGPPRGRLLTRVEVVTRNVQCLAPRTTQDGLRGP